MNKNTFYSIQYSSLLFLLLIGLLSSCGGLKKGTEANKDISEDNPMALLERLAAKELDAEWLNANARIAYKGGGMSVSGSANIRMKKDSLIWIRVKKLGFEVARAMITVDSVYILDRLNNEYAIYDLDYLEHSYNLPGDFQMVQNLFLGQPYFMEPRAVNLSIEEQAYQLTEASSNFQVDYTIAPDDLRLEALQFASKDGKDDLKAAFSEFGTLDNNQLFSYFRQLDMSSSSLGQTNITIKFSQIELDQPKDTGFRIPSRYTRMDD